MLEQTKENALKILEQSAYESFKNNDYVKAIIYYERYLEINPNNPDICNTLGYIYRLVGGKYNNIDKQIEYFEKAFKLDQEDEYILRNLALTYPLIGKYNEAVECFQKLFKKCYLVDDYVTYSYLKIRLKDFKEGWKYYENRFKKENNIDYPIIEKPQWNGDDIKGKTLLVHYEQGYGDSIMFFRYIDLVKPYARKIIFRVQDELIELIKNNIKDVEVVGISCKLESLSFDCHIPLLSLLHVLDASVDDIPLTSVYIKADEQKVKKYKNEFFNNDCLKIGISWNGTKFGNNYRDIPLEKFYPLTTLENIRVYSFQKGYGAEQLDEKPYDIDIINLGQTFKDFSDTAAAMENIDLFITSDNCLLNLAGAMGKKTLALLNKYSEWRWFTEEGITPWYDSVKILKKQEENEDWSLLFDRAIKDMYLI